MPRRGPQDRIARRGFLLQDGNRLPVQNEVLGRLDVPFGTCSALAMVGQAQRPEREGPSGRGKEGRFGSEYPGDGGVQRMRTKAVDSGKLKSGEQMKVETKSPRA